MTERNAPGAADDRARLVELLRRLGAGEDEITEALGGGSAGALALEAALRQDRAPLSPTDAARAAGVTDAQFADLWRALGFPLPGGPARVPPALVEALPVIATATREWLGEETGLGLARVIGSTTAQLAEAVGDAFRMRFEVPEMAAGAADSGVGQGDGDLTRASLPALGRLGGAAPPGHPLPGAAGG